EERQLGLTLERHSSALNIARNSFQSAVVIATGCPVVERCRHDHLRKKAVSDGMNSDVWTVDALLEEHGTRGYKLEPRFVLDVIIASRSSFCAACAFE